MLNIKKITELVPEEYKREFFKGNMKLNKGSLFYQYNSYNPLVIIGKILA